MNTHAATQAIGNDVSQLAADARALVRATVNATGGKIGVIRRRLAAVLDREKELAGRVRDRAVNGTRAANRAVRNHPYQTIVVAIGIGAILGYFVGCPHIRNHR